MDPLQLLYGGLAIYVALYLFMAACMEFGFLLTVSVTYVALWLLCRVAERSNKRSRTGVAAPMRDLTPQ